MTPAVLDLVRDVEEGFAEAVRAEAVAEERQRLAAEVLPHHWQTMQMWGGVLRQMCGRCRYGDGVCWLWPCPTVQALTGEPAPDPDSAALAAGSVPVATPAEPVTRCGEKRSQSDAGARWLNAEQYDSVALCCDEPAGHPGDHRCNEGKPGHDTWPNHEARTVAEPSVGTGTPVEAPTFDQLLTDPMEQFDRRSELLPAILRHLCSPDVDALLRSIEEYRNAPPATATTASAVRFDTDAPAEEVSGGSGHAERQEPAKPWSEMTDRERLLAQLDAATYYHRQQRARAELAEAEVARYRAAIEGAISGMLHTIDFETERPKTLVTIETLDEIGWSQQPYWIIPAAALGDGA